jgi:hypothetical protein
MELRSITRREFLRAGAAATLVGGVGLPASGATDPTRIALVVGNNAYPGASLANAVNDARAVAALLGQAGFTVTQAPPWQICPLAAQSVLVATG